MVDLTDTIIPKSDQLNADDLIGRTLTIKITGVNRCKEPEQPIALSFEGDNGKPYKPGKSMRRVLVNVWGPDGQAYVGRSLTLYRDDEVVTALRKRVVALEEGRIIRDEIGGAYHRED